VCVICSCISKNTFQKKEKKSCNTIIVTQRGKKGFETDDSDNDFGDGGGQ
jgi:hypothetical protein